LSSVGSLCWCGAHAALLIVSLFFGRKSCGRRSGGGESGVLPSGHVQY